GDRVVLGGGGTAHTVTLASRPRLNVQVPRVMVELNVQPSWRLVMAVLRVDASIQGPRSASSELADLVEAEWAVARPGAEVVRRHIGASPLPAQAWADAVRVRFVPEDERSSAQRAAVALAEEIARELRSAEAAI